jgi:zinc transport system ATP-binding protein
MTPGIVEIKDVTFCYKEKNVLRDVSLNIRERDFIAMIGPNGGGKTTLLKLILGLLKPEKGVIRVMGQAPLRMTPNVGYVPQNVHINPGFPITAIDVVLMGIPGRKPWRRKSASDRGRAMAAMERLEVGTFAKRKIGTLSGGQRQRVFIARAMMTRPKLMLLDEPAASIDTKGQTDLYDMLKGLNKDMTILVVSHDLLVISRYAKSVACVNKNLHYHNQAEITRDMLEIMYPCARKSCPVELVAHGLPHRVLREHN